MCSIVSISVVLVELLILKYLVNLWFLHTRICGTLWENGPKCIFLAKMSYYHCRVPCWVWSTPIQKKSIHTFVHAMFVDDIYNVHRCVRNKMTRRQIHVYIPYDIGQCTCVYVCNKLFVVLALIIKTNVLKAGI